MKAKQKKIIFSVIMLAIPVAAIVLIELFLRLIGYGGDYPLVKEVERWGKQKYVLNRQIGQRYFDLPQSMIPEASEEIFDREKKSNGLRLICVGGSTTAGYPFEINATFPFQLQFRLRNALLQNWVEVVNLGISAVNSYTVLDLMPEILELQPDAILIYMGHNEFYGAFGAASTTGLGQNRNLILTYLQLRRYRLVQLIGRLIYRLSGAAVPAGQEIEKTLMDVLSRDRYVNPGSEAEKVAVNNFAANLNDILALAREKNVPVLLSTLVANLKDHPPFASVQIDDPEFERLSAQASESMQQGDLQRALIKLKAARRLFPQHAGLHYLRGQAMLKTGNTDGAYVAFSEARDRDLLRFRAPTTFNNTIRRLARANDVTLVDMENVFRAAAAEKVPGADLFFEHLHPNFDGYRLMAQTFFEALRTIQIINPPQKIGWVEELFKRQNIENILSIYREEWGSVTALDLEFGHLRNFILTSRWPFPQRDLNLANYRPVGSPLTRQLAAKHIQQELFWDQAHYQLAEIYLSRKAYNEALAEYRAVNLSFYDNPLPFKKIGMLYEAQKQYQRAVSWYNRALERQPHDAALLAHMGRVLVVLEQFEQGLAYLEQSLQVPEAKQQLSREQKAGTHYLLAVCLANLRRWPQALTQIDLALRLQPDFTAAVELKKQIKSYQQTGS